MHTLDRRILDHTRAGGNKMGPHGLIEVETIWISRPVMRWDEVFMRITKQLVDVLKNAI